MRIPINITGGDYQHKSRPLTKQVCRNFWPQLQATQKAKSPYVLQPFYGLKIFKEQIGGADRGSFTNQGSYFKVSGSTFYQIASDGTHTAKGTIPGAARCKFSAMGASVLINNGEGSIYVWNGTTLTLNTSPNIGSPRGVTVLNNQAIYDAGSGQGFDVSDVGDPLTINGLNNAQAESASDALILPYAYRETLYLFGEKTIEPWWNSGQGNPPFDRIQGAIVNIGLGAENSVADTPDFIFFFGSDRQFYSLTGGSAAVETVISTPAMAKIFEDYSTVDDVIGWTMQLQGQWFYCATFPTENITWVFPVGGEWFQWGSGLSGRIRANSYVNVFGKHLVGDYASANIYELDAETYTDAGETIIRTRDTAPIHNGLLKNGTDGYDFEFKAFELFMEVGVGLPSGQGENPKIKISTSRDGGKTFGHERMISVGRSGDTRRHVMVKNLGRFRECVLRVQCSDPIFWSIYDAYIDIEACT